MDAEIESFCGGRPKIRSSYDSLPKNHQVQCLSPTHIYDKTIEYAYKSSKNGVRWIWRDLGFRD